MEITLGLPDLFAVSMPHLEHVPKGIKVRQGRNKPAQVSSEILWWINAIGQPHEMDPKFIMLWAA